MSQPSNKLYGVTHNLDGSPRVIEPKSVKVGIGLSKGPALHAYIDNDRRWVILSGYGPESKRERFEKKEEAQIKYRELKRSVQERKYPERLPYFTFSNISASGDMEPAWDIMEYHGPVPTEIDVIFIHEEPFESSFQLWTATERKCYGDGKVAMRNVSMAATSGEKDLAAEATQKGQKYFPMSKCWLDGCQYSKPVNDKPAPCRAIGRLCFQLLKTPRLGATAVFGTSGYRSISQIFSTIEIIRKAARGYIAGIPLKMVLRPYRMFHNGRMTTQYAVSLEFRAESVVDLRANILQKVVEYQVAGRELQKELIALPAASNESEPAKPELIPEVISEDFEAPIDIDGSETQSNPDEDPEFGPGGALDHAWDDAESAALRGVNTTDPRASSDDIRKFYELCRQKGMTDATIVDHLGSIGFEKYEEITGKAIPDLNSWAESYRPAGQGSLL